MIGKSAAADKGVASELAEIDRQLALKKSEAKQIIGVPSPAEAQAKFSWWSAQDAMTISTMVLLFGLITLMMTARLMSKAEVTVDGILRVFGTILIIFSALFLVVAGYSQEQMGPIMGLLGTIVGYLLGKSGKTP